jgi:hypothetical protein
MLGIAIVCAASAPAWAAEVTLFKVITEKDEIVIGLTVDELGGFSGQDAGAVAAALAAEGQMTVWQYAIRTAENGDLVEAPLQRIGLLANGSLRVEPNATDLAVVAPEAN